MPKKSVRAEVNSFVKGIITEANPLNFPADASLDEANFVLNKDGSRDRRLGLDFENNFLGRTSDLPDLTFLENPGVEVNTFNWDNAGGVAGNKFVVVKVGRRLSFYDASVENMSRDGFLGSVLIGGTGDISQSWKFAGVNGRLVVATGTEELSIVTYDAGVFTLSTDRLLVRDLFGVAVNYDGKDLTLDAYINTRPSSLDAPASHIYNLRNQSWGLPRRGAINNIMEDPLITFSVEKASTYPSNSESVFEGMNFTATTPPTEEFYPRLIDETRDGRVASAKGFFIIDALRRGTSRVMSYQNNMDENPDLVVSLSTLPADITPGGPTVVAEFAGRVWYGGFSGEVQDGDALSPNLSSFLLFSQLVKNDQDIVKCYQAGDPTSREGSDIVDTDGGFLNISGMKKLIAMVAIKEGLAVLAENGVWLIKGSDRGGFTASSYGVEKISEYGCVSAGSVVVDGSVLFYWAEDGIYVIQKNQFGDFEDQNISDTVIKKLYDSIGIDDKRVIKGLYDPYDRKVRWLFNQDGVDKELIFDVTLKAFSVNTFGNAVGNPRVMSMFTTKAFTVEEFPDNVVVGADLVVVGFDGIVVNEEVRSAGTKTVKYLILYHNPPSFVNFTFGYFNNPRFKDFELFDGVGVDAKAFILTGSVTAGDTSIAKQVPYLVMHMRRTEDGMELVDGDLVPRNQSSCLIRSQWDFANSANSNKWSPQFQAYRYRRQYMPTGIADPFDTGFELITTKNKIRGRGRAFAFYIETEPERDCRIVGWSLSINGNANV